MTEQVHQAATEVTEQPGKKLTKKEAVAQEQAAFIKKLKSKRSMKPILSSCSVEELNEIQNVILELSDTLINEAKAQEEAEKARIEKVKAAAQKLIDEGFDKAMLQEALDLIK